jgi:hypothetical protein
MSVLMVERSVVKSALGEILFFLASISIFPPGSFWSDLVAA